MTLKVSRRNFIKGLGITGAVAAAGLGAEFHVLSPITKAETTNDGTTKKFATCNMCMFGGCGTIVTVKDGVAIEVEGNPEYPINKGTLCARGNSVLMHTYNPYRIKAPMKRTNPQKGLDIDPGWQEISWDEALDIVATKFKEIRDNDPRELLFSTGFSMKDYLMIKPFPEIFGNCNVIESNGPLCAIHYTATMFLAGMPSTAVDTMRCNYFISVGGTMGPNYGTASGGTRDINDALARGMRRVTLDPRCSVECSGDEWIPIRPGNDYAFLLGMLHTMFYEIEKYDIEFLKDHTNAPYLIGDDEFYVRDANDKPLLWDLSDGRAKPFDAVDLVDPALEGEYEIDGKKVVPAFVLVRESMKEYTPEWAESECQVPADTIRRLANEFVEEAQIGATIELDGVTLPYRPVALQLNRGSMNHRNGAFTDLVSKLICCLVGNIDVPGGIQGCARGKGAPSADGTVDPFFETDPDLSRSFNYPPAHFDLHEYIPHRHSMPQQAFRTILYPEKYGIEYRAKGYFCCGSNCVISVAEPDMIAESIASIPFTVTIAYHLDEQAQLSDILLPEHSDLESIYLFHWTGCNNRTMNMDSAFVGKALRDPIPPIHNTKHSADITIEIFQRMGLLADVNNLFNKRALITDEPMAEKYLLAPDTLYPIEEIIERALKSAYGDDKGLDYFRQNDGYHVLKRFTEAEMYNYSYYPGRATRYPLYLHTHYESGTRLVNNLRKHNIDVFDWDFDTLEKFYKPTLWWYDNTIDNVPDEYDLYVFNFKLTTSLFRLGAADQNPLTTNWSRKFLPDYNTILIHTSRAQEKGLKEGDMVVIESLHGKTKGRLHVTELCHPQTLGIGGALGRLVSSLGKKPQEGILYNTLINGDFDNIDPIMGAIEATVRAKVYKA